MSRATYVVHVHGSSMPHVEPEVHGPFHTHSEAEVYAERVRHGVTRKSVNTICVDVHEVKPPSIKDVVERWSA